MNSISRRAFLAATGAALVLPALPVIPAFAADYKEADALKAQVKAKTGVDGFVRPHP